MNVAIGTAGIVLSLLASLFGIGVLGYALAAGRKDLLVNSRGFAVMMLLGAVVATIAMQRALLTNDTVQCWGANAYGAIGDGTFISTASPKTVVALQAAATGINSAARIAAGK